MLYYLEDRDIFNLSDKTIIPVIPVNCKGDLGTGYINKFKELYPKLFDQYLEACHNKELMIGHIVYLEDSEKSFILFPTKINVKESSPISYIRSGLFSLNKFLDAFPDKKIAVPPLGYGKGGLEKSEIMNSIYEYLYIGRNKDEACIFLQGF